MTLSNTFRRIALASTLAAATLGVSAEALAAGRLGFVSVSGAKQGKFKGDGQGPHKEKITVLSFTYEVKSPRDAATGQATGRRQHQPVCFMKEASGSTPQFFQATVGNEVLKDVSFEFTRTNPQGVEYVHQTVKLTDATIASFRRFTGYPNQGSTPTHAALTVDDILLEEICFSFKRIDVEDKDAKTMAFDIVN